MDGNATPDDLSETINVWNNEITLTKEEIAATDGIYNTSDDPNDPTNSDTNSDGEPDDVTVTKLHNPRTVITNRRITFRVNKN